MCLSGARMSIFAVLLLAIVLTIALLRIKLPIGPAIIASGLLIWCLTDPSWHILSGAAYRVITASRTYDLILALYFVVCLEIELRKSGCLSGMLRYLNHWIPSTKLMLAAMPAFLGLLPSVGGARFSAPIVEQTAEGLGLSQEHKSAINYWFRHVFEFASPIVPGMILACAINNIAVGELIRHMIWVSVSAIVVGWFVLLRPIREPREFRHEKIQDEAQRRHCRTDFCMCLCPILIILILMVAFGISASISIGCVSAVMLVLLRYSHRQVGLLEVYVGAIEMRLFRDVGCILVFIEILVGTGTLAAVVSSMSSAPLPAAVILAGISFIIGLLTGITQGTVAIVMPLAAALSSSGALELVGIVLVFGMAGQMFTPTHLCLTVTVDYFQASLLRTLGYVAAVQSIVVIIFSAVTYIS